MDKRYKPLTPHDQLLLRQEMGETIAAHPEWDLPKMLRHIRRTFRLTLGDVAKVTGVSVQSLKNIEAGKTSPTLATAERLLNPFGYRLAVARRPNPGAPPPPA